MSLFSDPQYDSTLMGFFRATRPDLTIDQNAAPEAQLLYALQNVLTQQNTIKRRTVLLGDSEHYLSGGPLLDGTITSYGTQGVFAFANFLSGQRQELVMNAGLNGDNTSNMLLRFDTDVAPYTPDVVNFWGGINDISNVSGSANRQIVIDRIKSNITAIYQKTINLGASFLINTLTPIDTSFQTNWLTSDKRIAISEVNQFIRAFCRSNKSAVLSDIATAYVNPAKDVEPFYVADSPGYPAFLNDGLHQAASGAFACARIMSAAINSITPPGNLLQVGIGSANKILNPSLAISGTFSLGAFASSTNMTSWTTNNIGGGASLAVDTVAASDIYGNWTRFTYAANTILSLQQFISSGFVPGDKYKLIFETELDATSTAGVSGITAYLEARNVSATKLLRVNGIGDDSITSGGISRVVNSTLKMGTGVVETPVLVVPATTSTILCGLIAPGNAGAILKIRKATLYKL